MLSTQLSVSRVIGARPSPNIRLKKLHLNLKGALPCVFLSSGLGNSSLNFHSCPNYTSDDCPLPSGLTDLKPCVLSCSLAAPKTPEYIIFQLQICKVGQRLFPRYSGRKPDTVMMKSKTLSANSLTSLSCFHTGFHSLYFAAVLTLASSLSFFPGHKSDFQTSVVSSLCFHKPFPPPSLFPFICSFCWSSLSLTM